MFRRSKNFLLGLAGLFGFARKQRLDQLANPYTGPRDPLFWGSYHPRPKRNAYRGIEQILESPDRALREYKLNWCLQNLRNASADTRRKWAKAANQFSWRMDRRPNQHPVAA